ncbi:MAG: polyprenyl synthetase family protein [Pseudomonadota bacterium]
MKEPAPIDRLTALLADDLAQVDGHIKDMAASDIALIPKLITYIFTAGGKRIRPLLTLAFAACTGTRNPRGHHIELAAAVEAIHTATLLHDDVIDESPSRRGRTSAHMIFGNQVSVLVGDYFFARAFQMMVRSDDIRILEVLSGTAAIISAGEVTQMIHSGDAALTQERYLEVIRSKTAVLFESACAVGAMVTDAPQASCEAAGIFGMNIGMAFQLTDDALDYDSDVQTLGKPTGHDLLSGKPTLPLILAYQNGTATEKAFWQKALGKGNRRDLPRAQELIVKYEGLEHTRALAQEYSQKAIESLPLIKTSRPEVIDLLADLARQISDRRA